MEALRSCVIAALQMYIRFRTTGRSDTMCLPLRVHGACQLSQRIVCKQGNTMCQYYLVHVMLRVS